MRGAISNGEKEEDSLSLDLDFLRGNGEIDDFSGDIIHCLIAYISANSDWTTYRVEPKLQQQLGRGGKQLALLSDSIDESRSQS
jgi:hypothetical protein